ncbi:probable serine/threonine-protein kinase kinX [Eriocheir sinensis]|uniref:probable serine/threonine-protein kinase kinX n=1 Tax=Eriocheir sinensis TaxID=95602 RepID=UPI0021C6C3AA|nr:probable serine/threonine-protein kinase kinX [Eriocheir sinensis]
MDDDDNDVVGIEQVGVEEMKNVVGVEKMILAGQDYDSDSIEDEEFLTTLLEAETFNDEEEKTAEEETFLEAGEFRSDLNLVDETSVPIDEQFQQQQQQYDDDDDSSEESEDEENTNNVLGTEENEKVCVNGW